jgi:hypothetical protein
MKKHMSKSMKNLVLALLLGAGWFAQLAEAQDQPPGFSERLSSNLRAAPDQSAWQKFDFDFPGGSPRDLVSAIEKTTGKTLNVIIPKEDETVEISALKFKGITVPDLFRALAMASQSQQQAGGTFYTFET